MIMVCAAVIIPGCKKDPIVSDNNIPPIISFLSPNNNSMVYDGTIVRISAGTNVVRIVLSIDSADTRVFTAPPYEYRFSAAGYADGSHHTLIATAYTADSMALSAASVSVTVVRAEPVNVEVISFTPEKIVLHWTDHSSAETGFAIESSSDSGATYHRLTTTPANRESITVYAEFTPGTSYRFRTGAIIDSLVVFSPSVSKICWITFLTSFSGIENGEGYCVRQTSDGGYIAGSSYSLSKVNSRGTKIWSSLPPVTIFCALPTTDGGYIGGTRNAIQLLKFDNTGTMLWGKYYGYNTSAETTPDILPTAEGGFAVLGNMYPDTVNRGDITLVITDGAGKLLRQNMYGGTTYDTGNRFIRTQDGGYAIAGTALNFTTSISDLYVIKTAADGTREWEKKIGTGTTNYTGNGIAQNSDGGFTLCGSIGFTNGLLVRTDAQGNVLWQKIFSGVNGGNERSLIRTTDNGYVVTGTQYNGTAGTLDVLLTKFDASGTVLWTRTFGGNSTDKGNWVEQTADGGYIIAGSTTPAEGGYARTLLIKTDDEGNVYQ